MSGQPLLKVENLKVHFRLPRTTLFQPAPTLHAVDGVDFEIGRKKTMALVGESGSGKTTCGLALLRLIEPTGGRVTFDGTVVSAANMRSLRRHMQIIFQDPYSSLNPRQCAGDIVRAPLESQGIGTRAERDELVAEMFALVGLRQSQRSLFPHQFSGGQRQRICIARALVLKPVFIVCDEPVSALDVAIQAQILNLLCEIQDQMDLTYLFISHDLAVVQHVSDEVGVMYLGKLVERTDRAKLFDNPMHPYSRALLSAVPPRRPAKRKIKRLKLRGEIPNPIERPSGCHFHKRCIHAQDLCKTEEPKLLENAPGHWSACHFAVEIAKNGE